MDALRDLGRAAAGRRRGRGDVGRGAARHRPRVRRDLIALRPQPGQVGERRQPEGGCWRIRRLSPVIGNGDPRVQDAYSLRCAPQVDRCGPGRFGVARGVADVEPRSAIDNPMVLADGRVESCGNFHGAPLGMACDFLAIAAAEVGAIAERRTDRRSTRGGRTGFRRSWLPSPGVDSGMMIAGYTQAALVAENRRLAAPASVDSLPTSAMQEDHVSMGWGAARKLRVAVANLRRIVAVELSCAARGLDLRAPLAPAPGTAAALARCCARGCPDRVQIATWRRSWPRWTSWCRRGRCWRRSRRRSVRCFERRFRSANCFERGYSARKCSRCSR